MPAPKQPNTAPARRKKKANAKTRAAAVGTLADVRAKLWACIERVEGLTGDADKAVQLKAVHAMVQACGAYVKVVEAGELEGRLAELEKAMEHRTNHQPRAYA